MPTSHWLRCKLICNRYFLVSWSSWVASLYPWQQPIWQQLINNPKPAHAYLLHGPEGTGKYQLALALAKYWLCQQPKQQACGQCSSCKLIAADSHPDLLQLLPVEKG